MSSDEVTSKALSDVLDEVRQDYTKGNISQSGMAKLLLIIDRLIDETREDVKQMERVADALFEWDHYGAILLSKRLKKRVIINRIKRKS